MAGLDQSSRKASRPNCARAPPIIGCASSSTVNQIRPNSNTNRQLNEQAHEQLQLGLFTLGGLLLLVAGLLAFGARSYFVRTSLFETYVAGEVPGLSVGSPVELRGVR